MPRSASWFTTYVGVVTVWPVVSLTIKLAVCSFCYAFELKKTISIIKCEGRNVFTRNWSGRIVDSSKSAMAFSGRTSGARRNFSLDFMSTAAVDKRRAIKTQQSMSNKLKKFRARYYRIFGRGGVLVPLAFTSNTDLLIDFLAILHLEINRKYWLIDDWI